MSSLLGFAPFQEILITVGIYCLKIRKEKRLGFCRPTEIPASNSLVVAALKHDEVTSIRLKIREKRKRMLVGPRMLLLVFEAFSVDLRIGLRKWVGWGREADSERVSFCVYGLEIDGFKFNFEFISNKMSRALCRYVYAFCRVSSYSTTLIDTSLCTASLCLVCI